MMILIAQQVPMETFKIAYSHPPLEVCVPRYAAAKKPASPIPSVIIAFRDFSNREMDRELKSVMTVGHNLFP